MPLWTGLPTAMVLSVGVCDDVVVMRPLQKFVLQLVVIRIVVGAALRFVLTPWRAFYLILAGFPSLNLNAFNLIDGLDGLA